MTRQRTKITHEAVELFRHGSAMRDKSSTAYVDLWTNLHLALGLKPWDYSPLDVSEGPVPDYVPTHEDWTDLWHKAVALRRELMLRVRELPNVMTHAAPPPQS